MISAIDNTKGSLMKKLVLAAILSLAPSCLFAASIVVNPVFHVDDDDGNPLAGGCVYTYDCGGSTKHATCADATCSSSNANPIELNSRGEADIYTDQCIKIRVYTADADGVCDINPTTTLVIDKDLVYGNGGIPPADGISLSGTYSNDIAAAITAIGATETTLVCDDTFTVASGTTATLNANTTWDPRPGCTAQGVAGGSVETLVIPKIKDPGDVAWVGADLTISGLKNCSPEWWGDNITPGTTDMTAEINSALASCSTTNLNAETYNISDKLIIRPFTSLLGKNNGGSGTVIYQADGSDIVEAMIVSAGWANDSVSADSAIVMKDIFINGNKASNTGATTHGIELMSWNCMLENVQVYGTTGDGIRFTDQNSAGGNLTSTAVENAVIHCRITQVDGSGVYTESHTSALTDGKIVNSTIGSVGEYGIMAGAGWKVNNNHLYDIGFDGIATTDGFNNITNNNSIQDWGQSSTVGTRYGIVNYSIMDDNPCSISSNQVELSTVTVGSTYYAYGASFATGATSGLVTLSGNQAQLAGSERFFTATGTGTGTAELFGNTVQNAGATLIYPNANVVRHVGNGFDSSLRLLAGSGTPSVASGSNFGTSSTNIIYTNFTDGFIGQEINVIFSYAPGTGYVDFTGSSLLGNGGADWTFAQYDSMRCIYNGTNWFCSISDNTL